MRTNCSWSIDDSRNKFQFGCEYGRMIRGGRLAEVVRNPNYRGISATFWRSLAMVGDATRSRCMGTPFCGKGEPKQVIRVGHASPACRFTDVAVFGGPGMSAGRAPGRSQAGPRPLGGPADVLDGRGAGVERGPSAGPLPSRPASPRGTGRRTRSDEG